MDTRRVPGIQQKGNKWRFRVRDGDGRRRWVWCDTLAEAIERKRGAVPPPTEPEGVRVEGLTLDEEPPPIEEVWSKAIRTSERVLAMAQRKTQQSIELPSEPCAIAFLSDLHLGAPGTDYRAARRDAEIVRDTPGFYAVFHGDGFDNWIIGKLQPLQRGQAVPYDEEVALFVDWLNILRGKLLAVVLGNHDNWSRKVGAVDFIRKALDGARLLFDTQQVYFLLVHGDTTRRVLVRHKWRGSSIYNVTHGIEVGWDRLGVNFDWGIAGHTHIGTYCRPFTRHRKRRHAILTGAYKLVDEFAAEIGFAPTDGMGCGAMVLHPDGREWWFDGLSEAAEFLTYLRSKGG